MTRRFGKKSIYLLILAIAVVATVTLRCIALFSSYDVSSGYFTASLLNKISSYTVVAFTVLLLSSLFTVRRGTRFVASFSTPATFIPTGAVCAALAFLSVGILSNSLLVKTLSYSTSFKFPNILSDRLAFLLEPILFTLGVLAILHFVLTATDQTRNSDARAYLGLCAVAFLGFYSAYLYFTTSLPMNAPNKTVDQMAYLVSALFFLYETRLSIGRDRWGAYTAFGLSASLLTAYSAIPSLIYYAASGNMISNSLYESILTLTLCIFITARLIVAFLSPKDEESPVTVSLKAAAAKRDSAVLESDAPEIPSEDAVLEDEANALEENFATADQSIDSADYGTVPSSQESISEVETVLSPDASDAGDDEQTEDGGEATTEQT